MRFVVCLFVVCFAPWVMPAHAAAGGYGQDLIVQFKSGSNKQLQTNIKTKVNVLKSKQFKSLGGIEHWQLASPMDAALVMAQLNNDPNVSFAEPNYPRYLRLLPNDPLFNNQWSMNNTAQYVGAVNNIDMNMPEAWVTTTGSSTVVVAVIDNSVDINHVDLYANIWTNPGEIPNNLIDDDNNGYVDDVHGWDFVDNDNDPSTNPGTGEGHGTMVSSCIGAKGNNGILGSGVNWNVSIMPLKFLGDVASELAAIDYAIAKGAKIINASWGGPQFSYAESAGMVKLLNNGVLLVTAGGNNYGNNDRVADYPSSLPYANVLAVGAHNIKGRYTDWTHYGQTTIDVVAPGESVFVSSATSVTDWEYASGTSFSSPFTAGVAALILAQYPAATYQEIKGRIMASSTQLTEHGYSATDGRVDAAAALAILPQPEIVISKLTLSDNNNQLIDGNETLQLAIELENVWISATGVTATLTSSDPLITISPSMQAWPDLSMGQKATALSNFLISTGTISGYHKFPFVLTITAVGYTYTRYFSLDSGSLTADTLANAATMNNVHDEFQYFHFDVPAGQSVLNVSTSASTDIDILMGYGTEPQFDYSTYTKSLAGRAANVGISATRIGNEQILVDNPQAGTWHVVVISYDQQPTTYQIMASTTTTEPIAPLLTTTSTSSGSRFPCVSPLNSMSPIPVGLIAMMLALHLRRRKMIAVVKSETA